MNRALSVLTVGAFLTLVMDVHGSGRSALSLVPAGAFVLLAVAGFEWVRHRPGRPVAYAYALTLLVLGYAVFGATGASVGSTLLLVVLVSQSVLLLPLRAAAVIVAIVPFFHVGMTLHDGLREGLGLLVAVVFAAVITTLLTREQAARADLAHAHARLREYAVQAQRLAAVQERNRVARDIHDGLGHSLTVVQMQVKAARAVLAVDPVRADAVLGKAQEQAEDALREVRRSVGALRDSVSSVPLPQALRALADQVSAAGVPVEVAVIEPVRPLCTESYEALFRAAQEGLTNVRKHARASGAEVTLDFSGPGEVHLQVRDDGAGVDGDGTTRGFGLVGIEERVAHLGGRMTLESAPGEGSTLSVRVPG